MEHFSQSSLFCRKYDIWTRKYIHCLLNIDHCFIFHLCFHFDLKLMICQYYASVVYLHISRSICECNTTFHGYCIVKGELFGNKYYCMDLKWCLSELLKSVIDFGYLCIHKLQNLYILLWIIPYWLMQNSRKILLWKCFDSIA